jgi:hypothetical protein
MCHCKHVSMLHDCGKLFVLTCSHNLPDPYMFETVQMHSQLNHWQLLRSCYHCWIPRCTKSCTSWHQLCTQTGLHLCSVCSVRFVYMICRILVYYVCANALIYVCMYVWCMIRVWFVKYLHTCHHTAILELFLPTNCNLGIATALPRKCLTYGLHQIRDIFCLILP